MSRQDPIVNSRSPQVQKLMVMCPFYCEWGMTGREFLQMKPEGEASLSYVRGVLKSRLIKHLTSEHALVLVKLGLGVRM